MAVPYHPPVKRSVEIAGHKTSISLEPLFWDMLREVAAREGVPLNTLVARIDEERIASPTPAGWRARSGCGWWSHHLDAHRKRAASD